MSDTQGLPQGGLLGRSCGAEYYSDILIAITGKLICFQAFGSPTVGGQGAIFMPETYSRL